MFVVVLFCRWYNVGIGHGVMSKFKGNLRPRWDGKMDIVKLSVDMQGCISLKRKLSR